MLQDMTRSKVIQVWFAAVALVVAAAVALGASVTAGTGIMLLALGLVPPAIVLVLWPGIQAPTVAQVLREADRAIDGENRRARRRESTNGLR